MPRHLVEQDNSEQLHILPVTFDHKDWSIPVEYISPKDCSMGAGSKVAKPGPLTAYWTK